MTGLLYQLQHSSPRVHEEMAEMKNESNKGPFGFGILGQFLGRESKEMNYQKEQEQERLFQPNMEVIACVFNPEVKREEGKWTCLSLTELPWEKGKYEILEVAGEKVKGVGSRQNKEFVGFNPENGETTWIAFNRNSILESLCEDIKSLIENGKSSWKTRK